MYLQGSTVLFFIPITLSWKTIVWQLQSIFLLAHVSSAQNVGLKIQNFFDPYLKMYKTANFISWEEFQERSTNGFRVSSLSLMLHNSQSTFHVLSGSSGSEAAQVQPVTDPVITSHRGILTPTTGHTECTRDKYGQGHRAEGVIRTWRGQWSARGTRV